MVGDGSVKSAAQVPFGSKEALHFSMIKLNIVVHLSKSKSAFRKYGAKY